MNDNMVNLLEKLRIGGNPSAGEFLNGNDVALVEKWYMKYCNCITFDIHKAVELMDFLYVYENIDTYPREEYRKRVIPLAERHCFESSNFINLFDDFRKMVFD
ncbi:MAG: hypothetical protein LBJ91_04830 [Clostridiales Family XIII bacterium]|jgi:hypothetical protein|nr:hypothetical protein [Clostridiales Family XIII bacterium]